MLPGVRRLRTFGVPFLAFPTSVSCVLGEDMGGWGRGWYSALVRSGRCLLGFGEEGVGCVVVDGSKCKIVIVLGLPVA